MLVLVVAHALAVRCNPNAPVVVRAVADANVPEQGVLHVGVQRRVHQLLPHRGGAGVPIGLVPRGLEVQPHRVRDRHVQGGRDRRVEHSAGIRATAGRRQHPQQGPTAVRACVRMCV